MTVASDPPDDDQPPTKDQEEPAGAALRVPDRISVPVPAGGRVLVCGDLHLASRPTAASRRLEQELAARLARWEGPGAVVLNGDVVELWGDPGGTVEAALDAHPALTAALHGFAAAPDRQVVVIVGNHDAPVAWDGVSAGTFERRVGARCALSADLELDTAAGRRVVRCEHGHTFDPANALRDPRDPLDSPLGQHIVQEVLPEVRRSPLLGDVAALADPNAVGQFVASRLVYRRLGVHAWWLLLPLLVAVLLRIPELVHLLSETGRLRWLPHWTALAGTGLIVEAAVLVAIAVLLARVVYAAMAGSRLGPRGMHLNGAPRAVAASLCAGGLAGFVTGHTHQPELAAVPGGFYANSGCGVRCVEARPARWFLPPVFTALLRRSWVELHAGRDVRVELVVGESGAGEMTRLERLAARRRPAAAPEAPEVVAALPGEAGWPLQQTGLERRARDEKVRRVAAVAVAAVAVLSLLSALTTPLRGRLAALLGALPVEVPQAAAATVVFTAAALLLLAWGLRRGRRLAWTATVLLLAATAVLHVVKGIDVEEAVLAVLVAGWLLRHRAAFPARPDSRQVRLATLTLAGGAVLVVLVSAVLVLLTGARDRTGAGHTAEAVAGRLVGDRVTPLPMASPVLAPALYAAGLSLLLVVGWLLVRPRLHRPPSPAEHRADLERARRIVAGYGADTLAYFALRDDKSWFFTGDCVVAYAVRDGVCLVSPDPVGPPEQWAQAWAEFTAFADRHGWPVSVVGAGAGWLPVYRASGMRPVYLGDEAIVDCGTFTLDGHAMKGLRGACNRVRRAGYTVRFYDPARLPDDVAGQLRELMTQSRRGDVERGFSMTLSRLFDPRDTGLLLAVAHGPDGRAGGFCHWIPAADISGWSLDVMRRSTGDDVPNGLTDFIIVETIAQLRAWGAWGLGLNFAVMRQVLAGERGEGRLSDLQRRLLHRFSDTMQIESLWRYNEKYRPLWRPRYLVLSGLGNAPVQGLAIADAEGVAELPVIGRLLGRADQPPGPPPDPPGSPLDPPPGSPSGSPADPPPDLPERPMAERPVAERPPT
ncbi:phosphatidylglycerol lysyltransferase domain-containing protein [Dactylosporangium sp. NPDC050688]|uniref:phosphatidylglycerol lysyltransferase domain-containing protein n=1 Tax=Dactylosporangium sp. NPDC050688 TaxID=3157217 RepID=UPI0034001DAD